MKIENPTVKDIPLYVVVDEHRSGGGDVWIDYYREKSEAVSAAEHDWFRLSKMEKARRIIYVALSDRWDHFADCPSHDFCSVEHVCG